MRVCFSNLFVWFFLYSSPSFGQSLFRVDWKNSFREEFRSQLFSNKSIATHFADSLGKVFVEQGYLEFDLREIVEGDTLFIKIEPGNRLAWGEINQGNIPDDWWKSIGKPGKGFSEPYSWMEKLIGYSEDSGYPFASVYIDSLQRIGANLFGTFRYEEGPKILWDSLVITGQTRTSKNFLQNYSGIVPGKPFSQSQLERAVKNISRSTYFKLDSIPQVTFQIKSAIPRFKLTDRKINVFDGIIGLIPNQNQANSMLVTGQLNLELFHLGGKGRDVSIHWLRPNIQSQNLEFSAKESFLLGSPINLQFNFNLLKQDSSFVNRELKLELDYSISDAGSFRFFSVRKSGDVLGVPEIDAITPSLLDFRWNKYGFGIVHNTLDNPISPRKGHKVEGDFSLGNKRILDNTSIPAEVYQGFKKTSAQWQGSLTIEENLFIKDYWGMWMRFKSGILGNENLYLNELFRLGGLKSLRGFNEMFFFSDRFAYFNFEQRFYFGRESYLMAFGDLGWINNPFLTPKIDRPKSFGLGMNLEAEGGMFSFVIGMGSSNVQPISLSFARIHFGYLARF